MSVTLKQRVRVRHLLGTPVLITALFATLSFAMPETAAYQASSAPALTPAVPKAEPVTRLKEKPVPLAARWVLPVAGYRLTAKFGASSGLWSRNHTGLDFAAPAGTPIRAIAAGVVLEAGWAGAYGERTIVRLADGTQIWYCHQADIVVRVGQKVMPGAVIGSVGSTGNVTGPHLHLEVRPDPQSPADPYSALVAHRLQP